MDNNDINNAAINIASNLITEIFKSVINTTIKSANWFIDKSREHDILGTVAKTYSQNIYRRYNVLKVLGMEKPIKFQDLVVRINILEKIISRNSLKIEDTKKLYDKEDRSFGITRKTLDGLDVVNKLNKFIVLGKPGSGKTTFLKAIMFWSLKGELNDKRIPIFLSIKDISDSKLSIIEFITNEFETYGIDHQKKEFIENLLANGKCQILLDGLDEVDKLFQDHIIRDIIRFSTKYYKNQIIISCRIAAYNHYFEHFTDVELADFNNDQINQFINNWFDSNEKSEACWKKLIENKQIKDLACSPLLLTLLCLSFNELLEFPANKAELYKEAIDSLLKKWDSSRMITRENMYKNFSIKRKEGLLSQIAARTFFDNEIFIKKEKLEIYIAEYIKHFPELNDENLNIDSFNILKAIERNHGIFVERTKNIYSFSHLTFQEYFTAKYICEIYNNQQLKTFIHEYSKKEGWREVFLLLSEILPSSDEFFICLRDEFKSLRTGTLKETYDDILGICKRSYKMFPSIINFPMLLIEIFEMDNANINSSSCNVFYPTSGLKSLRRKNREYNMSLALYKSTKKFLNSKHILDISRIDRETKSKLREILSKDFMNSIYLLTLIYDCLNSECYVSQDIRKCFNDLIK